MQNNSNISVIPKTFFNFCVVIIKKSLIKFCARCPLYGKTTGDLTRKRASDTRTPTMELSTDGAFHSFSYSCLLLRNEYALRTRCYCSN